MAEHDRLALAPILVEDLDAVFVVMVGMGILLLLKSSFNGTRAPANWTLAGAAARDSGQAFGHAGRKRRHAPMIMTTKNTSTMPWATANTGPEGGLPGASAVSAGTFRKLWMTSTNTLK